MNIIVFNREIPSLLFAAFALQYYITFNNTMTIVLKQYTVMKYDHLYASLETFVGF